MLRLTLSAIAGSMLALGLIPNLAHAQPPARVFVAAQGLDGNPCTFAAPCRSLQKAHNTVAAGGEIDVLDPAGYGALTITKSISIQGHGFAGIATASGNAITITAGNSDDISLRGLLIDGVGSGNRGIELNSAGSLDIQDSLIRNFSGSGLVLTSTDPSKVFISDTRIARNRAGGISSIGDGSLSGVIDRVVIANNVGTGLSFAFYSQLKFTVSDSVITDNSGDGVQIAGAGQPGEVMLRNVVVADNSTGVSVTGSNTIIRVTKSTITGNTIGFTTLSSGQIASYSDNNLNGNGVNGAPTSILPLQ
jgi:hypothetical protein